MTQLESTGTAGMLEIDDPGAGAGAGSENCLPVGTRLSDFEITGVLGEGGFGIVYLAFDHSLRRTVAIKEYMPGALAARDAGHGVVMRAARHQETFDLGLASFINEARFLARFDHPSLVKVYRFWEQNSTAYTAMQYYQGRTIKDIVARNPELVTEAWCLRIASQIMEALELLYTVNILHRDVAPDNIIVQESGDAVLLDFGSARQIIGDSTRGLTVILKPGYAPVEQYAGDASLEQGAFTDIYALAAVLYFAIVKEAPATSIARMIKDPLAPLASRGLEGYSAGFLEAIDKALAVLAQDRPQTIAQFRALIGIEAHAAPRMRAAGATEGSAPPAPASPAPAPQASGRARPARRPFLLAGAIGGALLLAGLVASTLFGGPSGTVMVAPASVTLQASAEAPAQRPAGAKVEPKAEPKAQAALEAGAEPPAPASPAPRAIAAKPAEPAPTSTWTLAIKPWGTVYVDGKERGVTPPLKKLVLTAGKHKLRVANPGFPDFVTVLEVGKNERGTLAHDFAAAPK